MAQQRRTREQWRRLVQGWPGSGLTQSQYCARHRISVASLHRWREAFHRESAASAAPADARCEEPLRLLPVEFCERSAPHSAGSALTLVLDEGLRVEIAPGFDVPTLTRLVSALRGCEPA
jgi:hypothetical protein